MSLALDAAVSALRERITALEADLAKLAFRIGAELGSLQRQVEEVSRAHGDTEFPLRIPPPPPEIAPPAKAKPKAKG